MGRRKIDIVRIDNERHRQVTFAKRKAGLMKKATELAVLCDAQVGVIVFGGNNGKMSLFSSTPMDQLLNRFRDYTEPPEVSALQLLQLRRAPAACAPLEPRGATCA
jgi:hypothetical protein